MADSRRRARFTYDDEYDLTERSVIKRGSISAMDTDPEEESFENEGEFHPTLFHSRFTLPSAPSSSTSSLPPLPLPPIPAATVIVRHRADARRWDWMPEVLEEWGETERIPTHPEVPGSHPPIPSLTREPVHHTIPVLVTRLHTLEHQLRQLELSATEAGNDNYEVTMLQHQLEDSQRCISQLEEEMIVLRADRESTTDSRRIHR